MNLGDRPGLCPDAEISALVELTRASDAQGLEASERLIAVYPQDPRLFFLRGSVLAGMRRYEEGHAAMAQAVAIAPDYGIARFQLGFLELTSGAPAAAEATWAPLLSLAEEHPLRLFVEGLGHLIRDEFGQAIDRLSAGIARNEELLEINADMRLLIEEARRKLAGDDDDAGATSLTQQLLQQSRKQTRH